MASTQYSFERREEKYFLTPVQYEALLTPLRQHMHADEHEQYTICSLYCDTPDWQLIRTSLEKPYYKEKLRVRSYGTPTPDGRVFVELKKKVGGIVYKRRIALPAARADAFLRGEVSVPGQIAREISWFQRMYGAQPRVLIAYDRTAFAGVMEPGLRVTFDTGIRWRTDHLSLTAGDGGAPLLGDDRILMELKTPDTCPLWLSRRSRRPARGPHPFPNTAPATASISRRVRRTTSRRRYTVLNSILGSTLTLSGF